MAVGSLQDINSKVFGGFNLQSILNGIGWLIAGIVVIAAVGFAYYYYTQKKVWNKKITVFEIIGTNFSPVYRDTAKVVKLGKGGFEVLELKKLKTWKLAYGGRVGRDTYYFFIMPDGYWYNAMMSASIQQIDKNKGLIPIVTTNPTMRAQYTALEKQIDSLNAQKKSFLDQYGGWIMSIGFVLIIGVLAWLIYREMSPLLGQFSGLVDKMTQLTDSMNRVAANLASAQPTNLVPVK